MCVPAVAKQLAVSADTVRLWIHTGELPASNVALRVGSRPRWRIKPADLEAFWLARRATPPPKPVRRRTKNTPPGPEWF
ncbi:MAG: helix-turn-helix domain-containing protein [Pirellulales bacterium]